MHGHAASAVTPLRPTRREWRHATRGERRFARHLYDYTFITGLVDMRIQPSAHLRLCHERP